LRARIEQFLKSLSVETGASVHTLVAYRGDLSEIAEHLGKAEGVGSWEAVEVAHVRSFAAACLRRGLGASSLARKLSSLRSFYRYGCRQGWFKANPALGVRGPRKGRPLPRALDEGEVLKIIRSCLRLGSRGNDTRWVRVKAMVELLYAGGLRASEALGLSWGDVDFPGEFVEVTGKGA